MKASDIRGRILATTLPREPAPVPEWGLDSGLYLKKLTIREAVAFDEANAKAAPSDVAVLYLAYALCDEDGARVFDPEADFEALAGKDPAVLERLAHQALKLNGLGYEEAGES